MTNNVNNQPTAEEQVAILQAVLETTRSKLGQAIILNTELEGLLILERQKTSALLDQLSSSGSKE